MAIFDGTLRTIDDPTNVISVTVEVAGDQLAIDAASGRIGVWAREEIRLKALDDGFHLQAEGDEVVLAIDQDAEFAIALNLRSAPPLLRRKIAALKHSATS